MKFCPTCGERIGAKKDTEYCLYCGQKIVKTELPQRQITRMQEELKSVKSIQLKWYVGGGALIGIEVGFLIAYYNEIVDFDWMPAASIALFVVGIICIIISLIYGKKSNWNRRKFLNCLEV